MGSLVSRYPLDGRLFARRRGLKDVHGVHPQRGLLACPVVGRPHNFDRCGTDVKRRLPGITWFVMRVRRFRPLPRQTFRDRDLAQQHRVLCFKQCADSRELTMPVEAIPIDAETYDEAQALFNERRQQAVEISFAVGDMNRLKGLVG